MTNATESDEWLTIDELSKISNISVKSIRRLRDRNKIPDCYLKISRNKHVRQLYHIYLVTFLEERKSCGLKLCEKITEDINQSADAIFDDEWLTPEEFADLIGVKESYLRNNFVSGRNIPERYIKRKNKSRFSAIVGFHVALFEFLKQRKEERKRKNDERLEKQRKDKEVSLEPEQPDNAVHVADPRGVYVGFWLTPEQAIELAQIRVQKRLNGNNEANVNLAAFNFDITPRRNRGRRKRKGRQ